MKITKLLTILLFSLVCNIVEAKPLKLVELGDVFIQTNFFQSNDTPFMPPGSQAKMQVDLGLNIHFLEVLYFKNKVHSQVDQHQFRLVGWNWQFGIRVTSFLEIGWEHFSRHTLDSIHPLGPFNEDSFYFKLKFNEDPKKLNSVFPF